MEYRNPEHYHIKVRIFNEEPYFGKGVAELLELIEEKGSLCAAYKTMGMSASKAWKIINRAEADLGFVLVESISGGKCGGGSRITPEAKELLERFRAFEREVTKAAEAAFEKIFVN
ncbi:MAG: winged helix-turn-helix domain-containing protein [Lachnospiraceae bacterium]